MVLKNGKGEYVVNQENIEYMAAVISDLLCACKGAIEVINAQHGALDTINKSIAEKAGLTPQITPVPPTDLILSAVIVGSRCIA